MANLSNHAAAAKAIRQYVKGLGIPVRATSESYAGGSSVRVYVTDLPPDLMKKIEEFAGQYEMGSFDGMQDLYEYTNSRDDIPQVKFVFVNNEISDELRQTIWDYARGYWNGMDDAPADAKDAANYRSKTLDEWGSTIIWQHFTGARGQFWEDYATKLMVA